MIDLGKHTVPVLSAYAISLVLLGALIWLTLVQFKRAKKRLAEVESRHG